MAEGGEDIPLDPLGPDRGRGRDEDDEHETSFGGDDWDTQHRSPGGGSLASGSSFNLGYEPDEEKRPLVDPVERRVADREKAEDFLKSVFVDPQLDQILCGVDDYNRVWVSLKDKGAAKYVHQPSGRFLKGSKEMSSTLKKLLGQTKQETREQRDKIIDY